MPRKDDPEPPRAEVIARIRAELTRDLYARFYQWADHASARLLALEGRHDPGYATALVADAIGDTYRGVRVWDPDRRSLRHHLQRVIESRLSHDVARARLRRYLPIYADDELSTDATAATEMSLRVHDDRTHTRGKLEIRGVYAGVFQSLATMAEGDDDVALLLTTYQAGHVRRDEVMSRLAWSLGHFVNVRRRLDTLIRRLPDEVKDAATDLLFRDAGPPPLTAYRRGGRLVPLAPDGDVAEPGDDPDESRAGDGSLSCDGNPDDDDQEVA